MPNLRKITDAQFNAAEEETCAKRKTPAVVKQYAGDVNTTLDLVDIPANTYEWLVFVPCDLVDIHWPAIFRTTSLVNGKDQRVYRDNVMKCFDTYELDERGMLFAFPAREGGKVV